MVKLAITKKRQVGARSEALRCFRRCSGGASDIGAFETYESSHGYEINLVLADGSRINLVHHGARSIISEDAKTLGSFLEVPVWDASGFKN